MDVDSCIALIRQHVPDLSLDSVHANHEGLENLVLEVNNDLIFRFPRPYTEGDALQRELRILPFLEQHLSLPLPKYEHVVWDEEGTRIRFASYRRVPGVALTRGRLLTLDTESLIAQMAALLDEMAAMPLDAADSAGMAKPPMDQPRKAALVFFDIYQKRAGARLDSEARRRADRFWDLFLNDADSMRPEPAAVQHLDLCPSHLLVDPETSRLSGIIDWSTVAVVHPAADLGRFVKWQGPWLAWQVHRATRRAECAVLWRQAVFTSLFLISSLYQWQVLSLLDERGEARYMP